MLYTFRLKFHSYSCSILNKPKIVHFELTIFGLFKILMFKKKSDYSVHTMVSTLQNQDGLPLKIWFGC